MSTFLSVKRNLVRAKRFSLVGSREIKFYIFVLNHLKPIKILAKTCVLRKKMQEKIPKDNKTFFNKAYDRKKTLIDHQTHSELFNPRTEKVCFGVYK